MTRFSSQVRQYRHEAILDAASQVACRHGWGSLTMDAVAAEAGVAKGTLYLHFPGKEALLEALADRAACRLTQAITEEVARAENPVDAVSAFFHRLTNGKDERASLAAVIRSGLCASPGAESRAVAAARALVERIEQLLIAARMRRDAPLGPRDTAVTLLALATFSACLGEVQEREALSDSLRVALESIQARRWGCSPDCPRAIHTAERGGGEATSRLG